MPDNIIREYVKEKGCEEILNDLYGVYDKVEEIPWDQLPNKFVQSTYGSGTNVICSDKSKLDILCKRSTENGLRQEY